MAENIFITEADGTSHTFIFGASGKGKSRLLEAEANRLGITYEELLQRMEPTEEENARLRLRQDEADRIEEQRLSAVRNALWESTPHQHDDVNQLNEVLAVSGIADEPTHEQIKALFMMLPANIIGSGLSWGFSDTEVREHIYQFVEQNKHAVQVAMEVKK